MSEGTILRGDILSCDTGTNSFLFDLPYEALDNKAEVNSYVIKINMGRVIHLRLTIIRAKLRLFFKKQREIVYTGE